MVKIISKGIDAAVELSGHKSERYIWRYIQASDDEMEETLESVTDALNGSAQLTEDTPWSSRRFAFVTRTFCPEAFSSA